MVRHARQCFVYVCTFVVRTYVRNYILYSPQGMLYLLHIRTYSTALQQLLHIRTYVTKGKQNMQLRVWVWGFIRQIGS